MEKKFENKKEVLDFIKNNLVISINISDNNYVNVDYPFEINLNNNFFEENKEQITLSVFCNLINQDDKIIIDKYLFSNSVFEKSLTVSDAIEFKNIDLTDEQIEKIKTSGKEIYINNLGIVKQIGFKKLINLLNYSNLQEKEVSINPNLTNNELENIHYISDESVIKLSGGYIKNADFNESKFYDESLIFLENLKNYNKQNKVVLEVTDKKVFSSYLDKFSKYDNINLLVGKEQLTVFEYNILEKNLDEKIKEIKNSNLNDLQKFLMVYNIVKKIKKYNKAEDDHSNSTDLNKILNNDYIVCSGFVNLLVDLLSKVGISAIPYICTIEKYDNDDIEYLHHAKAIVNIKDSRVSGYYLSDPTWDNDLDKDLYNYSLQPINSLKKSSSLYKLNELDLFLDISSMDDYTNKINYFIKTILADSRYSEFEKDSVIASDILTVCMLSAAEFIILTLKDLDQELYDLVIDDFKNAKEKTDNYLTKKVLTIIGQNILKKTNKEIDNGVLTDAIMSIKTDVENPILEDFLIYHEKNNADKTNFPYDENWNNRISR